MRPYVALALLAVLLLPLAAQAQDARWTAHPSLRRSTGIAAQGDDLWVSTGGGVYRLATADGQIRRFTAADGLHGGTAGAIEATAEAVWVGFADGVIDRIDPATGTITPLRDIARADRFASRGIRRIRRVGDDLYVATDFGIVVFDVATRLVQATYSRLGPLLPATPVRDVLLAPVPDGTDGIWAATPDGLVWASLTAPNLQDPNAWQLDEALPRTDVFALAYADGRMWAGTDEDLYRRADDGTWAPQGVSGNEVTDLFDAGDRLYGVERFNLVVVADGVGRQLSDPSFRAPVGVVAGPSGDVWIADDEVGLVRAEPATTQLDVVDVLAPGGPYDNLFEDLDVGPDGTLWAGGVDAPGTGVYRLAPEGGWTSYVGATRPELEGTNFFARIHAADDGTLWAASVGAGVLRIDPDGELTLFDEENSSLRAAVGRFIVAGGVGTLRDGTLIATTRATAVPLHLRSPDGAWQARGPLLGDGLGTSATAYGRVYVDSFEQVWIVLRNEQRFGESRGVIVLDLAGTPFDASDDAFRFFGSEGANGVGLPARGVNAVVEDRDGIVWLGTDAGLAFVPNSGIVARDAGATAFWPQRPPGSETVFTLFGPRVNDLAVDPAGRLWVATDERGVFLVQAVEGGYEVAAQYTTDNSPLPSDRVLALAVRPETGDVFMATGQGLVSFAADAVAAAPAVRDLRVYPNPAVVSGDEIAILIDGLVDETRIRIVDAAGGVVARFDARGGRARWDGRGLDGRLVPSGVYLVVASGADGEGRAYGKVAVIR